MDKLISIVIPSYNSASFLPETVPTFLNISESVRNMVEVIIVNDGSTDNTLEIANDLANQYPDFVRVIDKENGGHGSTINAGIKSALGKYFKIVDGDDYVDSTEFEKLLIELKTLDVDQVISPFVKDFYKEQKKEIVDFKNVESGQIYEYDAFLERVQRIPEMHSVIYKTSLLRENDIKLSEHCFYVDMQYNIFPMHLIKNVAYLKIPIYQYQLGDENQSVSLTSYVKNKKMHEHVIKSLVHYLNNHQQKLSSTKIKYINEKITELNSIQTNIYLMEESHDEGKLEWSDFQQFLINNHSFSIDHPFGKKDKILAKFPQLWLLIAKVYQLQMKKK